MPLQKELEIANKFWEVYVYEEAKIVYPGDVKGKEPELRRNKLQNPSSK